jgi:uncharacterized protein with FMN-binding domain
MSRLLGSALVVSLVFVGCARMEMKRAAQIAVNDVAIASVPDGSYTGSFEEGGFTYAVRCIVTEGRVDKIKVLQNRTTTAAKKAEDVLPKVVEQQKVNIDSPEAATLAGKALLKAVERALSKGTSKSAR